MDDHPLSDLMHDRRQIAEGTIRLQIETAMCEHHGEIHILTAFKERDGLYFPLCLAGGLSFGSCSHLLSEEDLAGLIKVLSRAHEDVRSAARCVPPDHTD